MPWAFTLILTAVAATEVPTSIDELVSHYEQIFKTGNRNAASHLWSSYILDRAAQLEAKTLETLFRGFCPVSGSPLPDQPQTQFYSTLSSVTGEKVSGITHHCCWPCICDTQSAVKTDTKEIQTASGAKSYTFLVIGDPCANSAKLLEGYKDPFTGSQVTLQEQAPEVTCVDNRLSGAHFSSRGHVIIGMYFVGDAEKEALPFNDASTFKDKCEARKEHGFGSGMGAIFQKVAAINPIVSPSFLQKWDAPTGSVDNQRLELALINIFGVVGAVGAALLIIMLARRQPKLNAGSDSEVE